MGRIRTVLPELIASPVFAGLTDGAARLCYGLLAIVDDAGRCHASPSYLAGQIFYIRQRPLNAISKLLGELVAAGLVATYEVDRVQYLEIVGFRPPPKGSTLARSLLSQRIDKPQPSQIPAPSWSQSSNCSPNGSTPYHDPTSDLRPPKGEGGKENEAPPGTAALVPRSGGKAEEVGRELVAAGVDLEATLVAAQEFVREKGIEIDNAEGFLVSWLTKALKNAGAKRPRRSGSHTETTPDDYEVAPWKR